MMVETLLALRKYSSLNMTLEDPRPGAAIKHDLPSVLPHHSLPPRLFLILRTQHSPHDGQKVLRSEMLSPFKAFKLLGYL